LELHSCKFVKIEPGRVGGLTPAIAIHDVCHHGCTPCWVGVVPQSTIGMRIAMALAAKSNFTYPADYVPMEELLAVDLAPPLRPTLDPADNTQRVVLPDQPGLGLEPDAKILEAHCVQRALVK
jgi:O-succinylbenzoate synthase